jgi:hypothetical protein
VTIKETRATGISLVVAMGKGKAEFRPLSPITALRDPRQPAMLTVGGDKGSLVTVIDRRRRIICVPH